MRKKKNSASYIYLIHTVISRNCAYFDSHGNSWMKIDLLYMHKAQHREYHKITADHIKWPTHLYVFMPMETRWIWRSIPMLPSATCDGKWSKCKIWREVITTNCTANRYYTHAFACKETTHKFSFSSPLIAVLVGDVSIVIVLQFWHICIKKTLTPIPTIW